MSPVAIYPFFAECGQREPSRRKRRRLMMLAIGCGGLILRRRNRDALLLDDGTEFIVPSTYVERERERLVASLWREERTEFGRLAAALRCGKSSSWKNLVKIERTAMIDDYAVRRRFDQRQKNALNLALVFKTVGAKRIRYDSFRVLDIVGSIGSGDNDSIDLASVGSSATKPSAPRRATRPRKCAADDGVVVVANCPKRQKVARQPRTTMNDDKQANKDKDRQRRRETIENDV